MVQLMVRLIVKMVSKLVAVTIMGTDRFGMGRMGTVVNLERGLLC